MTRESLVDRGIIGVTAGGQDTSGQSLRKILFGWVFGE